MSSGEKEISFLDFCSGIGGFRIGLEQCGFQCVGFAEIDPNCEKVYRAFFGNDEKNFCDITKLQIDNLPNFDLLVAGFPCQPFSILGKQKGLGDDRGKIIFYLINILKTKQPKAFLLENVAGLASLKNGDVLKFLLNELQNAGYCVFWKILCATQFGIPQLRKRLFIVGFRKNLKIQNFNFDLDFFEKISFEKFVCCVNEINAKQQQAIKNYFTNRNRKNYCFDELMERDRIVLDLRHSDLRVFREVFPTLLFGRQGLFYILQKRIFALTGMEALLLQGFPHELATKAQQAVTNHKLLQLAGNSVVVPIVRFLGEKIANVIKDFP